MSSEISIIQLMGEASLVVQLVVLLLIISSVFSWAIALFKNRQIKLVEKENRKFLDAFKNIKSFHDVGTLSFNKNIGLQRIMELSINEYSLTLNSKGDHDGREYFKNNGLRPIERSIDQGITSSNAELKSYLNYLASIGSITPFIGLFGTVVGIINSFQGLSQGGGSLQAVAPGIAEALVATAIGLGAAIPAVWFYNQFNSRLLKINGQMEEFSQELLNLVERSL